MSSQQGPVNRPWFRLASMMRPPPPPPPTTPVTTPQPEPVPLPRPVFILPTFRAPAPAPAQEPTRPPPPQTSVASPTSSPLVASSAPPPVASAPPPLPVPSPAPTAPSPPTVAAAQSPRTVAAAPSPTMPSPKVVTSIPMPSPKVVTSVPTMPSPRIAAAAPPSTVTSSPQIVAAQLPPTAEPQVPPTNGSPITNSPIKKESYPSFSSPRPKFSGFSSPSPPPKLASPSPPPQPSPSIVSLASSNGPTSTIPRNITTPISSPKIFKQQGKTPPPSPSMKPFAHPPSPLTLPPAQIKSDTLRETRSPPVFEQKTVLVQETREKQKASPKNFKGGQSYSPKHDITKENGNHKKYLESEDFEMRTITIAGDNNGAIMELSTSRRSNEFGHIKRGSSRSLGDGEKSGSINGNIAKDLNQKAIPLPITAFTNSNVQVVNNSIVYNCSIAHHDPGVHLSLSKNPIGGNGIYHKDRSNGSHN